MNAAGVIYILTNPSFPDYVKIGYADDIERRLKELNRSECVPFAFRVYATYEVASRLKDLKLHSLIDKLNPNLRSIETFGGQKRVREFYAMTPEDAFKILEAIAEINGTPEKLVKWEMTKSDEEAAELAETITEESQERQSPFSFSKCQIAVKEEVSFCCAGNEHDGEICTVVDDRHVEYNGKTYSLSGLATELLQAKWQVAGPRYFKYKGEWLNSIRKRLGV